MLSKICIFVIFQVVLVFATEEKVNFCEKRDHLHYNKDGNIINCCNNKAIPYGVKLFAHWNDCAVAPENKKEGYLSTMWRIYVCLIKKGIPNAKDKISITEFGKIFYADYPVEMKEKIEQKMNEIVHKSDGKSPSYVIEANLTDLAEFDRLRQNYFIIEAEACGMKNITKYMEQPRSTKVWTSCNNNEILHRGGSCCKNFSIPFTDNRVFSANQAKCSTALKPLSDKLELNETAVIKSLIPICVGSCILMENGKTNIDDITNFNITGSFDYESLIQGFLPSYFSETLQEQLKKSVKIDQDGEKISKYAKQDLKPLLGDKIEQHIDLLYGCYIHTTLARHINTVIQNYCKTPMKPKKA